MRATVNDFSDIISGRLVENEPLSLHTTYKIGGKCDLMIEPVDDSEVVAAIKRCNERNFDFYVMGNGSNLLIRDGGYRGVIINMCSNPRYTVNGNTITCSASALLSTIVRASIEHSLSGLEFAAGIPGTLGGAVTMNAGAYGSDISRVVRTVTVADRLGNVSTVSCEDMHFGYRKSLIREEGLVVLSAELVLTPDNSSDIRERISINLEKRRRMQPLTLPSCGSVFKRPEGYYIGKLIEDAGLKGTRVGGAEVSTLHANFIVNVDSATAGDVLELIEHIKKRVFEYSGVKIETEVIVVGED